VSDRNIKLTIEYDGTHYHGWQIQPNATTIQEVIQNALTKITQAKTQIFGAGRTDTGVHAAGQVANFLTHAQMSPIAFQKALNALLPIDIAIIHAEETSPDFHARFSATSRTYRYTILNRTYPSAFLRNRAYFLPHPMINVQSANTVCHALIGKRDCSSFRRTGGNRVSPVCDIYESRCWKEGDLVHFEIEADAFLRGMIRAIIGTILKLHDGVLPVDQFHKTLEARDRSAAGPSAPACGLSLTRVKYDL
jgi:tRNA pseudouridine38-40 synthase